MIKTCTKCKKKKDVSDFHKHSSSKDGLHSWCKPCALLVRKHHYEKHPEINKKARIKARQLGREFIRTYLSSHPCVDCGNDDIRVLDFDHVRGIKDMAVTELISYSVKRIILEISKCEVRCSNCHRIRHWEERNNILRD